MTSMPLLLGGGLSVTLRFATLPARPPSFDDSSFFCDFLGVFGVAGAFLPAGSELELAHHFAFAKFEPFARAASTMSSGLGSEKTDATNRDDWV